MLALNDVAMTRVKFEILPNLHVLQWLVNDIRYLEKAMLFMHQHVRHLIISTPPIDHKSKSSFFAGIYARMPHLHSLDLRVNYAVRLIEADILELLRGLPDLKKVIFPEFYFTSNVISQLSRMRHINIIGFEVREQRGEERDVASFVPILEQGAFPVLQSLSITAHLGAVTRFMSTDFAPTNLTSLYINNYVKHEPEQVHMFLVTLSEKCRCLSKLYIKLLHVPTQLPVRLIPAKQITFGTLRPVLSFPNLTTFKFTHEYPVNITSMEIEELASRWPSLEVLYLNKDPLVMHATLDLRALMPFFRHCPKLRELGLFMDATAQLYSIEDLKPFASLRLLCVGASQARNPDLVAAFLSHMCPPGCKIKASSIWSTFGGRSRCRLPKGVLLELEKRSTHWKRVIDILPALIHLRRDERERMKVVQEELEDLRTKNRLLIAAKSTSRSAIHASLYYSRCQSLPPHLG